ncbi:hypothetical protein CFIMG_008462RA00001 [Ceratocystis fimbriata CBS 114723]|uniref:BZIP domain-containing protein n=1 Tax=Ceratocystis fimbriata CBS 114723 TaxID=1035309 RepID=A0A2C5X2V6_9PEZI|nr:hypothetical protein CFIMG_008462RA00001 [Ceratocystis fimbriata CBS 114723]
MAWLSVPMQSQSIVAEGALQSPKPSSSYSPPPKIDAFVSDSISPTSAYAMPSPGSYSGFLAGNSDSDDLVIHEFGHKFSGALGNASDRESTGDEQSLIPSPLPVHAAANGPAAPETQLLLPSAASSSNRASALTSAQDSSTSGSVVMSRSSTRPPSQGSYTGYNDSNGSFLPCAQVNPAPDGAESQMKVSASAAAPYASCDASALPTAATQKDEKRPLTPRQRNRHAAARSRHKKKMERMMREEEYARTTELNSRLHQEVRDLCAEVERLHAVVQGHAHCNDPEIGQYLYGKAAAQAQISATGLNHRTMAISGQGDFQPGSLNQEHASDAQTWDMTPMVQPAQPLPQNLPVEMYQTSRFAHVQNDYLQHVRKQVPPAQPSLPYAKPRSQQDVHQGVPPNKQHLCRLGTPPHQMASGLPPPRSQNLVGSSRASRSRSLTVAAQALAQAVAQAPELVLSLAAERCPSQNTAPLSPLGTNISSQSLPISTPIAQVPLMSTGSVDIDFHFPNALTSRDPQVYIPGFPEGLNAQAVARFGDGGEPVLGANSDRGGQYQPYYDEMVNMNVCELMGL